MHIKSLCVWIISCGLVISSAYASTLNIGEIDIDFCNNSNKLLIETDAGKQVPLCINIKNQWQNEGTISVGFVDGEMSQWDQPTQACKTSSSWIFWKSAILYWENVITIKPWQVVQKTWELLVREWYAWSLYGCITANAINKSWDPGSMFSIVSRKANLITVVVSWVVASNLIVDESLQVSKNAQGIYTVAINLVNSGTSAEEIDWNLEIKQWLRFFKRTLPIGNKTQIYPEETKEIRVEAGKLPWYGGKFTFTLKAKNTPVDITNKPVGPGGEFIRTYTVSYGLFKYGLISLIALLAWLWIIWYGVCKVIILRKRKKKNAQDM